MSQVQAYEDLRDRGLDAVEGGRIEEALGYVQAAYGLACEHLEPRLVDRAFCNLSAVGIELGHSENQVPRLREILVRNVDLENCRLAAYNIARAYQLKKDYKKALFYARIALDRSLLLGRPDWIASAHNRIGNILLGESYFDRACGEYERALELVPPERSIGRALILDNHGYCRIVQGRHEEGFRDLYLSLRILRSFGALGYERYPHLALCFAFLEIGRYRDARRHGEAALALSEKAGDVDSIKNSLYLLGEAANLAGHSGAARGLFTRLQERFYPRDAYLPDFLLAIDVRKLINLKA